MQLDVINTPIVVTALIAGLISMVILLYPIVAYSKEFNRINQTGKSYMEIFAKVFGIQFSLLLFITAIVSNMELPYFMDILILQAALLPNQS